MTEAVENLSDKEKETLRLMLRGHDAKSMASALDLSVHTINERLRAARRKLGVTSSREAARVLFESEGRADQNSGYEELGDDSLAGSGDGQASRRNRALLIGGIFMSLLAAALLLTTPLVSGDAGYPDTETVARNAAVEGASRRWLDLVGAGDWEASYAGTAAAFRQANTLKLWSDTARKVQGDLGTMQARRFVGVDDVPSPQGFTLVKFRTDYSNRKGVTETLSLVFEDRTWKVAGIYVS